MGNGRRENTEGVVLGVVAFGKGRGRRLGWGFQGMEDRESAALIPTVP